MRGEIPVHLIDDDVGAFMCEGNSFLFTWGMIIAMFSCMRGRISINRIFVDLPEEWRFSVHSFVRGRIPVHLLEGWWFRCFHVWGVGYPSFTWGMTISVHSCVRGEIPVHLLEGWWFRCIHVWGVGYRCIYLRDDDFGAFMCERWDIVAFTWEKTICGAFMCEG